MKWMILQETINYQNLPAKTSKTLQEKPWRVSLSLGARAQPQIPHRPTETRRHTGYHCSSTASSPVVRTAPDRHTHPARSIHALEYYLPRKSGEAMMGRSPGAGMLNEGRQTEGTQRGLCRQETPRTGGLGDRKWTRGCRAGRVWGTGLGDKRIGNSVRDGNSVTVVNSPELYTRK